MINESFVILYKKKDFPLKTIKGSVQFGRMPFQYDAMSEPQQYHFEPCLIKYEGFTCFTYTL